VCACVWSMQGVPLRSARSPSGITNFTITCSVKIEPREGGVSASGGVSYASASVRSLSGALIESVFPLLQDVLVLQADGTWVSSVAAGGDFSATLSGSTLVRAAVMRHLHVTSHVSSLESYATVACSLV
jgi:hypothetical protein